MTAVVVSGRSVTVDPVRLLLRAEGLVPLALSVAAFSYLGFSWWLFAATVLLPDLAMIGYLRGNRIGALAYNAAHTYLAPFALGLIGWFADVPLLMALAAVWAAHIGVDRVLGYGLKLPIGFKATHLSPEA